MRLLKLAFISFIFLFLLITGFSLFIPSHVRISKAINIASGADSILGQVSDIGKWKNWYPGFDTLPLLLVDMKDGHVLSAKAPGAITIVVTDIQKDEVIAELRSGNRKPLINGWKTISYPGTDSVTVQWYMDFKLRWYPWEKFSSLLFESNYGGRMEMGLGNLKKLLEGTVRH
jgi:hypothetical protein